MSKNRWLILGLMATLMVAITAFAGGAALANELPPGGTFTDDTGDEHEAWIEAIWAAGITKGCNPPVNDRFCPDLSLTRAQMASIFVRSLDLPAGPSGRFSDTDGNIHEQDIEALAAAGITVGCNPPENTEFCPDRPVRRGEMAAFIFRAMDLDPSTTTTTFKDDDFTSFEREIESLVAAGLTDGCGDSVFCPWFELTRAEMAAFIGAALGLDPIQPPPPPFPEVGNGKRIIYSNSQQQVWLINENNELVDTYLVSGRVGIPHNGTYTVYSKSVNAWAPYGGITMKHMVRFVRPGTWGNQWAYGFHSIPRYPNGQPMQTEDELGYFRSGGCVRQADHKAAALYAWAGIGTTVHAIP